MHGPIDEVYRQNRFFEISLTESEQAGISVVRSSLALRDLENSP